MKRGERGHMRAEPNYRYEEVARFVARLVEQSALALGLLPRHPGRGLKRGEAVRGIGGLLAWVFCAALAAPLSAQAQQACIAPNALGVTRTIAIDTTGGPWLGTPHGDPGLLAKGEVVLTFDDGPLPHTTRAILAALAAECTKATFFVVGQMAVAHPEVVREVASQGHTIGSHTWSHANLRSLALATMKAQVESGFTAVQKAADAPIAPFFRYPYLSSSDASVAYLKGRDIAQFAVDIDPRDYRTRDAQSVVRRTMAQLEARGRGIILLHDIHASTALAVPTLLARLKEKGFKIVHLKAKAPVQTVVVADSEVPASRPHRRPTRHARPPKPLGGVGAFQWPFW